MPCYEEMYGEGKKSKFIVGIHDFLNDRKKIKPGKILKALAKAFKLASKGANIAGELAPEHKASFDKYAGHFDRAGSSVDKVSKVHGQYKNISSQLGTGRRKHHHSKKFIHSMKKLGLFLTGHTKIKPEELLLAGGIIAAGVGTVLDATGIGAVAGVPLQSLGASLITTSAAATAARAGDVAATKLAFSSEKQAAPSAPSAPPPKPPKLGQSGGKIGGIRHIKRKLRQDTKSCRKRLHKSSGFTKRAAKKKCNQELSRSLTRYNAYTGLQPTTTTTTTSTMYNTQSGGALILKTPASLGGGLNTGYYTTVRTKRGKLRRKLAIKTKTGYKGIFGKTLKPVSFKIKTQKGGRCKKKLTKSQRQAKTLRTLKYIF